MLRPCGFVPDAGFYVIDNIVHATGSAAQPVYGLTRGTFNLGMSADVRLKMRKTAVFSVMAGLVPAIHVFLADMR